MNRYSSTVRDEVGRTIPGVSVYVYEWDYPSETTGALSSLFDDDLTTALPNPLTTDEFGEFYFNTANGAKLVEYHYAGRLLYREQISIAPEGSEPLGLIPAKAQRPGKYLAFDASGDAVVSSGTGTDAGLRTDLAADGGDALLRVKRAETGAVGRTLQAKLRENRGSLSDWSSVPTPTAPDGWYWDYTNADGAGIVQLRCSIPNTVSMSGGANVQGVGLAFTGQTTAQTPNAGFAETNMIRMTFTVNSGAGQQLQTHLINGTLICAHDVAATGNEGAVILGTMRATGPVAGGSATAIGLWGGDLHVEKASGVADGKMVGLEIGMTKAPALGSAKNIGIDVYSDDRSGITATRAGTGLRIGGGRGWTNFVEFVHTDGVTDICLIDQGGNLTITAPASDQVILFQTNQNNTTSTNEVIGRTSGGVNVQAVMQADKSGQIKLGAASNHPVLLLVNNIEVGRWIAGGLNLASGKALQVNSVQVVGARDTGWAADTGTAKRTANATYTGTAEATYTQATIQTLMNAVRDVSQTQKAIKDAAIAHGLIGA